MDQHGTPRHDANAAALARFCDATPVLTGIAPALEVVPGMTPATILTSGPPLPWEEYDGGQRNAIIGAALFEGLAADAQQADAKLRSGAIRVQPCHAHGCVGSLAGVYTASMPVLIVENTNFGNRGFCNIYEGNSRYRLNYGVYNSEVHENLVFTRDVISPVLGAAVRAVGGVSLRPIMRRALHMGDELHSRNTAATLLFTRELILGFLQTFSNVPSTALRRTIDYLRESDYFFLRLSMAASKATADAAHGIIGSSLVTAMGWNCRQFGIRVSGLGDSWFTAPIPPVDAKFFEGHSADEIEYMGGESVINETAGLGGFAQAAAFGLQAYQGGYPQEMARMNLSMYDITVGEHPEFTIPYFGFRGTPIGIDIYRVVETGVTPVMDIGVAGKGGGQIGAGVLRAPMGCFAAAKAALERASTGVESVEMR